MTKKTICYWLFALAGLAASLLAADHNTRPFSPTAVLIDGFCVHQRSARAPTLYYCSMRGLRKLERQYPDYSYEFVAYRVNGDVVGRLYSLASSAGNRVDEGGGKFLYYIL